jgi:hypothetical protein
MFLQLPAQVGLVDALQAVDLGLDHDDKKIQQHPFVGAAYIEIIKKLGSNPWLLCGSASSL